MTEIYEISRKYWPVEGVNFDEGVVSRIYNEHMLNFGFGHKQIQALEFTEYFERYLWPHYETNLFKNEKEFIVSICVIVNEKLSEKVNPWETFNTCPAKFPGFFQKILEMILTYDDPKFGNLETIEIQKDLLEHIVLIQFLNNCFLALTEVQLIFDEIKYLLSLGMWTSLTSKRLEEELSKNEEYKKKYKRMLKSDSKTESSIKFKRTFLPKLLNCFLVVLDFHEELKFDRLMLRYLENCLILFINLESMMVSRRYLNAVIDDKHLIVRAQNSEVVKLSEDSKLFFQLLEMLDFYVNIEIDEITGSTLSDMELECRHRKKLQKLQTCVYQKFKEPMKTLWMSNFRFLEDSENFTKCLIDQSADDLRVLASDMQIIPEAQKEKYCKDDIIKMFSYSYKKRTSTLNRINNLALYPTEELIYDENLIPDGYFALEENFAMPKLSVQYLSFHDYLMRNFDLFRLEASYEIKQDIEQCLSMMKPVQNEKGDVIFNGWSRMGLPIDNFQIVEIGKPEIGRNFPRFVRADITAVVNTSDFVRKEWENLAKHDPCFLLTVCPKVSFQHKYHNRELMASQVGLAYVRGCEIEGLLDSDGKLISEEDRRTKLPVLSGTTRTWRVKLDQCQYYDDVSSDDSPTKHVYESFTIFMRRKPKENNFKAVLDTIRDLMNDHCVVPDWLQDLLLGYDQPAAAHYSAMGSAYQRAQNWGDTFLSAAHLRDSFPQYRVALAASSSSSAALDGVSPPFRLKFPAPLDDSKLLPIDMHKPSAAVSTDTDTLPIIEVEPYRMPLKLAQKFIDPMRHHAFPTLPTTAATIPGNRIPFTPTQIEAIRAGMQHGLTLVIGPPGTGKTDVAVQIINNLYRNYPNQRTLIVTHSNQALNQLFDKIICLGIDERHLLRLGHGEEALETTKDFSKYGRVNHVLWKRLQLLKEVETLSVAIGCIQISAESPNEPIYTCETAQHFLLSEIMPRWTAFQSDTVDQHRCYSDVFSATDFVTAFPFLNFFIPTAFQSTATVAELFPGADLSRDFEVAQSCFRHLLDMFIELDDFRSFELMRNGLSRANSLLVQHARIVAMTCTHAALRRRDLIQLGFTYDNILIEEAAQILEIETFIPLLLQTPDQSGLNRLKRWVMIGDHNQLPPVIKNTVFQNYCNMGQSMFARLVKLGVPAVQLNAQGRSRASLRELYGWRYAVLQDLPTVVRGREFVLANPGLLHDYQLIDVPDYLGHGETEPTPHFIQNLAEAEYCVAFYMYLRAIGYPAARISILTTYNGQKHLIRDVVKRRCADIGCPSKITTVDRFQGQQNDYVILSLVRTKNVGHLRDVRRLVVALSRARLGLYVFCRTALFAQCRELQKSFGLLMKRRTDLALVGGEHYQMLEQSLQAKEGNGGMRGVDDTVEPGNVSYIKDVQHMTHYVDTIYSSFMSMGLKRKADDKEHEEKEQDPEEGVPSEKQAKIDE